MKNFILLGILSWVCFAYAGPVAKETIHDAQSYKIEPSVEEIEAQRSVAGEKIKKKRKVNNEALSKDEPVTETDSEVRYWQYSE